MKKLELNPNVSYFIGYYLQDFKDPVPLTNKETNEVTMLDLHRVLFQFLEPVDPDRWGCDKAVGSTVSEIVVPLDNVPSLFGKLAKEFSFDDVDKLLYTAVHLTYTVNKKGKAVLRGITPVT